MEKPNGKPKAKVGRPRVLDDVKKSEIIRIIKIGGSREKAAMFVGCDRSTITEECKRDESFSTRLMEAEGECYAGYLTVIAKAAKEGDTKSAQWFLARKYPAEFAQTSKHAITDAHGKDLTPNQRQKLIDAIIEERKGLTAGAEGGQ